MRYVPTIYTEHGGSLLRSDPRAKADFIAQHMLAGWSAKAAAGRYQLWRLGLMDTNPIIDGKQRWKTQDPHGEAWPLTAGLRPTPGASTND